MTQPKWDARFKTMVHRLHPSNSTRFVSFFRCVVVGISFTAGIYFCTFSSESNRGGESRAEQCLAFCFYYLSLKSDVSTWWATWLRARGNLSFCQHRISRILIVHSTYTELTWTPRPRPRPLKVVEHFVLPSKLRKELALFAFVVRAKKKTVHVIQVMRMRVRACACVRCTRMLESTK